MACKAEEEEEGVVHRGREHEEEDAPMELAGRVKELDRQGPMMRIPGRVFLRTTSPEIKVDAKTLRGCKGDEE